MKKLILFTAMALLVMTSCNKKSNDEVAPEIDTNNEAITTVTENVATAEVVAPVVDAAKAEVKAE